MAKINVITWNGMGETRQGAQELANAVNTLAGQGWLADVIVVQQANPVPDGHIHDMLARLGGPYQPRPAHVPAGGRGRDGYLLLTRSRIAGQGTFARVDLAADRGLCDWLGRHLTGPEQADAADELATMEMPALATLAFGGVQVKFLTWRVPRGPGRLLQPIRWGAEANPDAFLFLQNSDLSTTLGDPGANNLSVIAGDINVTAAAINADSGTHPSRRILPGFVGVSNNLQHIIGHGHPQQPYPSFPIHQAGYFPVPGHAHAVLYATAVWQTKPRRHRFHTGRHIQRMPMYHR